MKIRKLVLLTLIACAVIVASASAESDIGFKGIGAKVGYLMPEDPIDPTIGFGVQVKLGTIVPNLALDPFVEYWSKSYETSTLGGTIDASFSVISIGAMLKYYIGSGEKILPYGGAGVAFNIGKSKVDSPLGGSASASDTDFGFCFGGGVELPFSENMKGMAEVKYSLDGVDFLGIYGGVIYLLK